MSADLTAAARRARVLALFTALAWVFGMTPPVGERILLAVLALTAIAADVFLDEHKTRVLKRPGYDTAA